MITLQLRFGRIMGEEITCPRCGRLILPQNRYCEHCGVDLAVAAALAEQQMQIPVNIPGGVPIAPEILVPRIGDYLIERGLLTPEALKRALQFQEHQADDGQNILLGQALLKLGLTTQEILDQVVTSQILELQTALSEANQALKQRVEERTQELQKALERLSELNHLKSNFIANISHELRTPLTHIKGYLDILADGGLGALNDAQIEAVNVLMRAENRLETLIEDLLQFSLASKGEFDLTLQYIDINNLIQIALDRSKYKARIKDISLDAVLPERVPLVYIDEDKIGWVLLQLLDNAIKFTPAGGQVAIQTTQENSLVTISVTDTGIGIPIGRITEIFEPFHQLDGSTTRRYAGTGLGLAMVRRIIEAHGSEVKVESALGQGSRFSFNLASVQIPHDVKAVPDDIRK